MGTQIGRGSFGECRDCVCLISKTTYAVKIVKADTAGGYWSSSRIFDREVSILKNLKHENVVTLVDAISDNHFHYIIMEKYSGGELFDKVVSEKRFREPDAASVMAQVLRSIEYVHSIGIVHRDIKSENFLFAANGTIKLIDFGLSVRLRSETDRLSDVVGSAHYLAPEMLRHNYSKQIDLYSAGVLLYLLLFGRYPFEGTEEQIFDSIKHRAPDLRNDWLSSHAMSMLTALLEKDWKKRLTATDALQHPFIMRSDDSTQGDEEGYEASIPDLHHDASNSNHILTLCEHIVDGISTGA